MGQALPSGVTSFFTMSFLTASDNDMVVVNKCDGVNSSAKTVENEMDNNCHEAFGFDLHLCAGGVRQWHRRSE